MATIWIYPFFYPLTTNLQFATIIKLLVEKEPFSMFWKTYIYLFTFSFLFNLEVQSNAGFPLLHIDSARMVFHKKIENYEYTIISCKMILY